MSALPVLSFVLLLQTPPVPPVVPPRPPVAGQAPAPQNRDQAQRPPLIGKGSIAGIVSAENGQPLKNARVNLSGGAVGRSAITDASGAFTFDKLPEGRYNLSASRPRYLSSSYGQKRPDRPGMAIQLADGEQLKNMSLTLFSAGVITGNVYNEDGEPVQGAQVRALRYTMNSGVRRLQNSNSVQSDDRGAFRLFGLTPGEYIVTASSNQGDQGFQFTPEMAQAIERASQAASVALTISQMNNGVATLSNGQTLEAPSPVTYAPTYYPGTTSPGSAVSVPVRGGEERSGIDVSMQKVQTSTVSGSVIVASGPLPQNITIQIQSNDEAGQALSLPSARVGPDGRFSLRSVPPGQYTVIARVTTTVRMDVPPATAAAAAAMSTAAAQSMQVAQNVQTVQTTMTGRTSIAVDGQPLNGVVIALDPGRTLAGRVSFEGAAPPDLLRTRFTATLQPMPTPGSLQLPNPGAAIVGQDGTFKIIGIAPGRYTLRVNTNPTWSMKSSEVNGRDTLDFPFDVGTDDIMGALVTMIPPHPPAELTGLITDAQSKPVTDYTIIVFSADQRFWIPSSRRIFTLRPGTDGRYTLRGVPPGDYQIAAVNDLEPGAQYDQELLKAMLIASTRVTIGEGAKLTQDLRVSGK